MINNLGDLLLDDPTAILLIDKSQGTTRSFSAKQIDLLAMRVANGLSRLGICPGSRVAIYARNSCEFIATYLGILKVGAVVVLINVKLPHKEVEFILNDSKADIMFTESDNVGVSIPVINFQSDLTSFLGDDEFTTYHVEENATAIITYTSGTTSHSKGVVISHSSHIWAIFSRQQKNPDLTVLTASPMYHMNGLVTIETALVNQHLLVLLPAFNAHEFNNAIEQFNVDVVSTTPSMIAMAINDKSIYEVSVVSVSTIVLGTAPTSRALAVSVNQIFTNARIRLVYGSTEIGPDMFTPHPDRNTIPLGSVGYPREGIDYRLVDGILQIRSPSMMSRYANNTSNKVTADGFFITNDLFSIDDTGAYYFEGRADDMFVSGGNNIYPKQIETILEDHSSVIFSAVVGVEDDIKGTKPYAFVVSSVEVDEQLLKEYLFQNLPPSHCPRRIWIIDEMPLTNANKINKLALVGLAKELLALASAE